jgi:hypothetical protein
MEIERDRETLPMDAFLPQSAWAGFELGVAQHVTNLAATENFASTSSGTKYGDCTAGGSSSTPLRASYQWFALPVRN